LLQRTGNLFTPFLITLFFLRYPKRSVIDQRVPWLKTAALAATVLLWIINVAVVGAEHVSFVWHQQLLEGISAAGLTQLLYGFGMIQAPLMLTLVLIGLAAVVVHFLGPIGTADRRRLRIMMIGSLVGLLPLLAISTLRLWGMSTPLSLIVLVVLTIGLFPLSFVYAVVRHEVFGIRVILRRSLRYALVSRGFLFVEGLIVFFALYYAAGPALVRMLPEAGAGLIPVGSAAAALLIVGALLRINRRVMPLIDRRFFRQAYRSERILMALSRRVKTDVSRPESVLQFVTDQIVRALHPSHVAVFLADDKWRLWACETDRSGGTPGAVEESPDPSRYRLYRHHQVREASAAGGVPEIESGIASGEHVVHVAAQAFVAKGSDEAQVLECVPRADALDSRPGDDDPRWRARRWIARHPALCDELQPFGVRLIVPLATDGELFGFLVLGEKLSEEPYSRDDKALLLTVGEQVAIALDYCRLVGQEAEQQALKREMQIAQEVQRDLLPSTFPPTKTLRYTGSCSQAREIGGDYFDFVSLGADRLGLAFCDVSGKGISAALLMASLQAMIRSHAARRDRTPAELIREINVFMESSTDLGRFATFFYGEYDDHSRELTYVNAGHEPPLLLRADPARARPAAELRAVGAMAADHVDERLERLGSSGMPVGWFADETYEQRTVSLAPGDLLVIYSDGVTDTERPDGEMYGDKRLRDLVVAHAHLDEHALRERVLSELRRFRGPAPQRDDLTLIVLRAV
ncbi:MAG: SpoIIE family protein phosphatase, partial [Acidobacteriota bacterium]